MMTGHILHRDSLSKVDKIGRAIPRTKYVPPILMNMKSYRVKEGSKF